MTFIKFEKFSAIFFLTLYVFFFTSAAVTMWISDLLLLCHRSLRSVLSLFFPLSLLSVFSLDYFCRPVFLF